MTVGIVVRRSAMRVWLVALLAAPFWIFGADLIFQQRLLGRLADFVYPGEIPAFEARDSLWAWLFVLVGLGVTVWALKELITPRRMLIGDRDGLALAVLGPLRRPLKLDWDQVSEVQAGKAMDDGDLLSVLSVTVTTPELIPEQLWGARSVGRGRILILGTDWDTSVEAVADRLAALKQGSVHPA